MSIPAYFPIWSSIISGLVLGLCQSMQIPLSIFVLYSESSTGSLGCVQAKGMTVLLGYKTLRLSCAGAIELLD